MRYTVSAALIVFLFVILINKNLSQVAPSGGDLAFMVIFSDLPSTNQLEEFTVNVSQADSHQPKLEDKNINGE